MRSPTCSTPDPRRWPSPGARRAPRPAASRRRRPPAAACAWQAGGRRRTFNRAPAPASNAQTRAARSLTTSYLRTPVCDSCFLTQPAAGMDEAQLRRLVDDLLSGDRERTRAAIDAHLAGALLPAAAGGHQQPAELHATCSSGRRWRGAGATRGAARTAAPRAPAPVEYRPATFLAQQPGALTLAP